MNKTIRLLALLLAVQLVAAVAFGWLDRGLSHPAEEGPLVEVARDRIDRVSIEGPEAEKVVLAKADGGWQLADDGGFPADAQRVEQLLERLDGLRSGTPVATSTSARTRFKVDDEVFERRVALMAGNETVATLYLGTSPRLRRVHARADGEDAIHSVELATYDVPVKATDWQDKSVVSIPSSEIQRIEIAGVVMRRAGDGGKDAGKDGEKPGKAPAWVAEGLDDGEHVKPENIDRLVSLIGGLRFSEVLGREAKPAYGLDEPVLAMQLARKSAEPVTYRLGKSPEEETYTLHTSLRPEYFRIDPGTAKSLIDAAKRESLVESQSPA